MKNHEKRGTGNLKTVLRRWQARIPVFIRNLGARVNPEPIFICGNYKTGSSAIASLLGFGTRQKTNIDLFWRTSGTVKRKLLQKELPLDWYVHRYRYLFSKKIIKEPDLIFYMDQMEVIFPRGRFVFLLRDPRDNIRSILNFLKLPGNAKDLTPQQIKDTPGSIWEIALDGTLFGVQGDNYIATQALRWNRIVELYEQYRNKMILLKYESFRQNKTGSVHWLADQLGLKVKADITPFLNRQYQPKGEYPQRWLDFYGRENLARIEFICGCKMRSYGYTLAEKSL